MIFTDQKQLRIGISDGFEKDVKMTSVGPCVVKPVQI